MTDRGSLVVLLCAEDGWIDGMEASHVDGCLPPAGGRERGREHPQPQRAASAELIEPQRAAASPSEIPAAQFSCAIDFFLRDRVRNWTSKPAGPGCARPALDVAKQVRLLGPGFRRCTLSTRHPHPTQSCLAPRLNRYHLPRTSNSVYRGGFAASISPPRRAASPPDEPRPVRIPSLSEVEDFPGNPCRLLHGPPYTSTARQPPPTTHALSRSCRFMNPRKPRAQVFSYIAEVPL